MFKRIVTSTAAVVMSAAVVQATTWEVDKAHSSVSFSVKHMVISTVSGNFNKFDGTIQFDPKDLSGGSVEFTVNVASVDTDNEKRDGHLRTSDFFDVENHPEMTFVSKKVHDINGNNFKITGDLTIRGTTKEVTFDCMFNGTIQDPWGGTRAGFAAETTINRQDFGVSWNNVIETGGLVVSDEVKINLELELSQAA